MVWHYHPIRDLPKIDDVVWCRFPEDGMPIPGSKLRPVLVRATHISQDGFRAALSVSYGTKNLKKEERWAVDLIIEGFLERYACGLPKDTRFDLSSSTLLLLPWCLEFFDSMPGKKIVAGRLNANAKRRLSNRLRNQQR